MADIIVWMAEGIKRRGSAPVVLATIFGGLVSFVARLCTLSRSAGSDWETASKLEERRGTSQRQQLIQGEPSQCVTTI